MVPKENQMRGVGLFFAGIGSILGAMSNKLPGSYRFLALALAVLLLVAGVIFVFKSQKKD